MGSMFEDHHHMGIQCVSYEGLNHNLQLMPSVTKDRIEGGWQNPTIFDPTAWNQIPKSDKRPMKSDARGQPQPRQKFRTFLKTRNLPLDLK